MDLLMSQHNILAPAIHKGIIDLCIPMYRSIAIICAIRFIERDS